MSSPNLPSYTGSLSTNTSYKIEGKKVVWVTIGSGQFSALSSSSLSFSGQLDEAGQSGSLDVGLSVTGDETGTIALNITDNSSSMVANGPCTFSESGSDLTVSFTASVNGNDQPMSMVLTSDDDGVEITVGDTELWIGS